MMEDNQFSSLNINENIVRALTEMGFEEPTPIQREAIPCVLEGRDLIGQAQTGTGKTCAYGIPAIQMCAPEVRGVQTLVLCPTRELAIQVADELKRVTKYVQGCRILAVYGGQPIDYQIMALKRSPQIIIGTPGRVMDHMRRHTLRLENLRMLVLDEADEMLQMGFREDIDTILQDIPDQRQMLLFSATMPEEILHLTEVYQKDPVHVSIARKELTVEAIDQYYIEVREASKLELLCRLIDVENAELALVFCNTRRRVDHVASRLQERGYPADALHGDMKQNERDRVMNKFRNGVSRILVATDVAARGLDVSGVSVVFNYDIPEDPELYVHRIGRTGRAGKSGKSYSFIFGRDLYKLREIMRYTRSTITGAKPPTIDEVLRVRTEAAAEKVRNLVREGGGETFRPLIERLVQEPDAAGSAEDLAAVLFGMAFPELQNSGYEHADFDEEVFAYESLDMTRLFLNVGRLDRWNEARIVKTVASASDIPGRVIGSIEMHRNFSFVDIPARLVDQVMEALQGMDCEGRILRLEVAAPKKRGGSKGADRKKKRRSRDAGARPEKERRSFAGSRSGDPDHPNEFRRTANAEKGRAFSEKEGGRDRKNREERRESRNRKRNPGRSEKKTKGYFETRFGGRNERNSRGKGRRGRSGKR